MGLPSRMAVMSFLLALLLSLQTVFLETFILFPASSKVHFSKSTSRRASTSAASSTTGVSPVGGNGSNLWIGDANLIVTGFGGLPILPLRFLRHHLCLLRCMIYVICHKIYIVFCALIS